MGLRSAIATRLTRAALALGGPEAPEPATAIEKAFGSNEPPAMAVAARDVSQMDMQHPFAPGEPIGPYDGYGRTPRQHDFITGYNIATRPRTNERVSFDALRGLIDCYDVASICIWHKIDTLRGVRWKLLAADGYKGDVSGAVDLGMRVMRRPDGIHNFRTWFGKWFYDVLAYDAAPLYRMRNRAGRVIGLLPFDGTTLAPLLDYWGNPPVNPGAPPDEQPEAYVQYANGVPWNWLTRAEVIYEPFRAVNSSIYGKAPIESIILNANTDLRFQVYFLQKFTEGNLPAAFAAAPETWSPQQIEQFQGFWDSYMYADQARKHQIRWMPAGAAGITWSNEKDFSDIFSLFMMRKTTACFHIVPTDLGFTETSNYSSGESQADVQHKAGELPPMEYAEEILSRFLYDDLGLPIKFEFDRGEDQDDRLVQAQSDDIYIKNGTVSVSYIRELRFGEPEPEGQTVPRFIYSSRAGAIPLSALMDVAGPTDPETGAPMPGAPLPHHEFAPIEGVVPVPPPKVPALAERLYGPDAIPPPPPEQAPVAKEAAALPAGGTEGITSETGIYGYDGPGHRDDDDEDGSQEEVLKELATFRRFAKTRLRAGQWRDFEFRALSAADARSLNTAGREAVAKAAPGPKASAPPGASQPATQPPSAQQAWPGWQYDLAAVAFWVPFIIAALTAVLSAKELAEAWLKLALTSTKGTKDEQAADLTTQARKWLTGREKAIETALGDAVRGAQTDGYAIGAAASRAVTAGLGSITADMGGWTPGATEIARALAGELGDGKGLSGLLDQAGVTIKSIASTELDRLARTLAIGTVRGSSAEDLARVIGEFLTDPSRAEMIVGTELARASNAAAVANYQRAGVREVIWVGVDDDRECPTCLANEAASPRPLGDDFPSGDKTPPAHPRCRCVVIPLA